MKAHFVGRGPWDAVARHHIQQGMTCRMKEKDAKGEVKKGKRMVKDGARAHKHVAVLGASASTRVDAQGEPTLEPHILNTRGKKTKSFS